MRATEKTLPVSVVFAAPTRQYRRELDVPPGTTAAVAIELSGIREAADLRDEDIIAIGIFGHRVEPGTVLRAGDRVELYRALALDPKEARRKRAEK